MRTLRIKTGYAKWDRFEVGLERKEPIPARKFNEESLAMRRLRAWVYKRRIN